MLRNPRFWEPFGDLHRLPDLSAIAGALRRCGRSGASNGGRSLHCLLLKNGLSCNTFLANSLIAMYADLGAFYDAQVMFDEMPEKNVASWTASIAAHCDAGNPSRALGTFSLMLASGPEEAPPNSFTLSAALKACAMAGDLRLGRQIHGRIAAAHLPSSDTVLMNSLLDFYVHCGELQEARRMFHGIPSPNAASWNTMIGGYFKVDRSEEAEAIFLDLPDPDAVSFNTVIAGFAQKESPKALEYLCLMHRDGHGFDGFTFPCALKACGGLGFAEMGRQIHGCLVKSGLRSSHCGSSLIHMYSSCAAMEEAMKSFAEYADYGGCARDLLALSNAMVSGFVSNGLCRSALRLVSELHRRGFALDAYTLSSAARACADSQDPRSGLQVHGLIAINGHLSDPVMGTLLVELYTSCGDLWRALTVFNDLPRKDVISWGGIIAGCVGRGSNQLGFSLFKKMMKMKGGQGEAVADQFILSSVLKACAGEAELAGGRQVHAFTIKLGFAGEDATATSLIDMYSKCGEVDDAIAIFRAPICRDTACWTAAIVGCAINGRPHEALGFLREMAELGMKPNGVTFLGALSACRHAGLVGEACDLFRAMEEEHRVAPSPEHRRCLVDILCRAGRAGDAQRILDETPHGDDEYTWNSLLGAVNGAEDIQGLVGAHLLPVDTSAHVTLSNSFARFGRWEDSALVKGGLRRRGSKKVPGMSWIEIRA
ncbi:unnamed protein product [Spirodela intermedia]|uniref:Uncharacterized protein n=1 Tax=Spirodela intermedia TaxID=51605 RepID=A0A7I8L6C9_SPIIN|nr:unnamed protein product [Spirodela intermedia]